MTRKTGVPPRWPMRILQAICPENLVEEIEGDVIQKFERDLDRYGAKVARRRMMWNAVRFLRPGILLRNKFSIELMQTDMILNYFKTAWRNLIINKFYSSLNLAGLTLGLAVGLLILLWVNSELRYDSFHAKGDRLYRMNIHLESSGTKFAAPVVQPTIAPLALKEVPGIENAVRVNSYGGYSVYRYQDVSFKEVMPVVTDPSLFQMFDYKMLNGNPDKPFPDIHSVLVTQSAARRFFGDSDPMGKIITGDNKDNFVVTGVVADFPEDGWMHCDLLFSTDLLNAQCIERGESPLENQWWNYGWAVFLQVAPSSDIRSIEEKLSAINYRQQPNLKPIDAGAYELQALKDLHLYNPDGTPAAIEMITIFSVIAGLILLIASINYVNLSTARALLRSKEVSVRKVIGASRGQLFLQFIVQTFLFFAIALVLSFGLMALSMPFYNDLSGKHLQFDIFNPLLWKVIGSTVLITLMASSIYPALLLSSFHPIKALKGIISWGVGNTFFRKALVVVQFSFSVGLIICTLIIGRQLDFIFQKDLGYDKSFVFSIGMNDMKSHYESARTELLSSPAINAVTSANGNITKRYGSTLDVDWEGKDPNGSFFIHDLIVDKDFMSLFKFELTQGKTFTGSASDSSHFVLNETAVRQTGIKDPIGKKFRWHSIEGTIIGVVKDFHFFSLKQKIKPFVFTYRPTNEQLFVKATGKDLPAAIKAVEKVWTQYNPGAPFAYQFMDESFNNQYQSDQRSATLFKLFTGIAVVISCLGLLGLATYTAQIKVKEIGIRKVLGASASAIALMLTKDFLALICISIIVAIPSSWFIMKRWIEDFAYRTNLPWWIFALSGLAAVLIAVITIGYQAIRSAIENPVKSLKSE